MPAAAAKTYDNINAALVAFQKDIPTPTKDSHADTGKYGYDYASLDKLTPLIFEKLSEVGLAYTASPTLVEVGGQVHFVLDAKLVHSGGQSIGGLYPLGNPGAPAQAIGSAITYARRYALLSLTGVAPGGEDDDGAAAAPAAGATIPKPQADAPAKDTVDSVRDKMGLIINSPKNTLDGDNANAIMEEVAPGKTVADWTLTDLKKGLAKLEALARENAVEQ